MIIKHNSNLDIKLTGEIKTSTKGMDRFLICLGLSLIILAVAVLIYLAK